MRARYGIGASSSGAKPNRSLRSLMSGAPVGVPDARSYPCAGHSAEIFEAEGTPHFGNRLRSHRTRALAALAQHVRIALEPFAPRADRRQMLQQHLLEPALDGRVREAAAAVVRFQLGD